VSLFGRRADVSEVSELRSRVERLERQVAAMRRQLTGDGDEYGDAFGTTVAGDDLAAARTMKAAGKSIAAVREIRSVTDLSLKDAKDLYDRL